MSVGAMVATRHENGAQHAVSHVPDIVPIDLYNAEEGKFRASVLWIVAFAHGKNIPDQLREPFSRDSTNALRLKPSALYQLTNGDLYALAGARLFRDNSLLTRGHAAVLQMLQRRSVDVVDVDRGQTVTETVLSQTAPFRTAAHVALIDAFMALYIRQNLSVERVAAAVRAHVAMGAKETPIDVEDALLFWINKLCAAVRDQLDKAELRSPSRRRRRDTDAPLIPEMEDLYEDMCDGACLCTLVSFYRPDLLPLTDVCFNDPMGIGDCSYNINLLANFCARFMPVDAFHFHIEDILYMHECLKLNVDAFLVDLFVLFEGDASSSSPTGAVGARRCEPIASIPDLRGAERLQRPVVMSRPRPGHVSMPPGGLASISASLMNSADSLMTQRSADSLKYRTFTKAAGFEVLGGVRKSPTTTFGQLSSPVRSERRRASDDTAFSPTSAGGAYGRADTMPAKGSAAAIRLQLEQKRRQHETQRMHLNSQLEKERQQLGKDAFFTLLGKTPPAPTDSPAHDKTNGEAVSYSELNETMKMMQDQMKRLSTETDRLHRIVEDGHAPSMSHAVSQPAVYQPPQLFTPPPPPPPQAYFAAPSYSTPIVQQSVPIAPPGAFYAASTPSPQPVAGFGGFRLHTETEPPSRLDPPLELNKNLTNWGMTYRSGAVRTPRRMWDAAEQPAVMATRSEMDLTYAVDLRQQQQSAPLTAAVSPPPPPPVVQMRAARIYTEEPTVQQRAYAVAAASPPARSSEGAPSDADGASSLDEGASPLRPPKQKAKSAEPELARLRASAAEGFVVAESIDNGRASVDMEERKRQLMANTLRRKEETERNRLLNEQRKATKRLEEERKQDQNELKKMEEQAKRQRILEEYQRKKAEEDSLLHDSAAMASPRLTRGQSQPPRPKSQLVGGGGGATGSARPTRNRWDAAGGRPSPRALPTSGSAGNLSQLSSSVSVSQVVAAEPSLKLFKKPSQKSNRSIIINALQYSIFAGVVNEKEKGPVLEELARSDSKHFLVLFRDQKCQYRGLYSWDEASDTTHRLHGKGPKMIREDMVQMLFKYDSGAKKFSSIPSRHLSATIDAFTMKDELWQKPKIALTPATPLR